MKRVDLTSQCFGRLTVVALHHATGGKLFWQCQCACGSTVVVAGNNLRSGNTQSCGCLSRESCSRVGRLNSGIYRDLQGQRYGRLVVVSFAELRKGKPFWRCRCDCGNEKVVMGQSLRNGATQSCGCLHRETAEQPRKLLAGQRFGRLVATKYVSDGDWECVCDCGNRTITRSSSLANGHTQSCGCYGHEQAANAHTTHGLSHTREYIAFKARERLERKRRLDTKWTLLMERCLREQQPACVICGATCDLTTDHVRPLSKGNGLRPGNAVTLCQSCNSRKSAKDLEALPADWQEKIATAAAAFNQYWNEQLRPATAHIATAGT